MVAEGNDWFEWTTGTLLKGGQIIERSFTLTEYPVYVKAGSVLPLYNRVKNLNSNSEEIIVNIFPGENGSFTFMKIMVMINIMPMNMLVPGCTLNGKRTT